MFCFFRRPRLLPNEEDVNTQPPPRLPGGHSALSLALASQSQSPDGPADFSAVERLLLAYYSHAAIDAEGNYLHGAAAIKNVDNYFALEDLLYFISQVPEALNSKP